MKYIGGSVLQFTPDSTMNWIVEISVGDHVDWFGGVGRLEVMLPVVGWGIVVVPDEETDEDTLTRVEPIVHHAGELKTAGSDFDDDSRGLFTLKYVEAAEWMDVWQKS